VGYNSIADNTGLNVLGISGKCNEEQILHHNFTDNVVRLAG